MSVFTENEIEYLKEQRLGRLATVDAEGRLVGWRLGSGAFKQNSRSVG